MTSRLLLALGFALVCAATPATAQRGYDYDARTSSYSADEAPTAPGVRVGVAGGVSIYNGPDILYPAAGQDQDDVMETNPAITGFVSFPLADRIYGRALVGLLNLGAEPRVDSPAGANPFLTNEQLLLEGNLLYNLTPYASGGPVPYVFSGFGALIADPFNQDDVSDALDRDRVAYVLPLGIGVDIPVARNLSLFGEASYRFTLNDVGFAGTRRASFGPCDEDPTKPECQPPAEDHCEKFPNKPECQEPPTDPCDVDPTLPECGEEDPDGDSRFRTRFGTALLTGGLQLGFGGSARPYVPPVPEREVIVERETLYVERPTPPEPPKVCDLVELNSVYFDYGSSTLSPRAMALLDENVDLLLSNTSCCLYIDGYTDSAEASRFGMGLAGRRAQAVYDYYLARGVAASRLQLRNRGAAMPACDKEDPGPGCTRNRRVESIPMDCERFRFLLENPSYDR